MTTTTSGIETPSAPDPLSAELERALFKRFWTWLAVVGSVVIVVVTGFSVLASQVVSSLIDTRVQKAIDSINQIESRSFASIDRITAKAQDSAFSTIEAQVKSAAAADAAQAASAKSNASADAAQAAAQRLQLQIGSLPNVDDLLKNTDSIVTGLAGKKDFVDRVSQAQSTPVNDLKRRLTQWGGLAPTTAVVRSGPGGGSSNTPSMCPDGSYMVGVTTSSNTAPPYCIGCLNGLQAICRPLNAQ
jgi:hypothetical protein